MRRGAAVLLVACWVLGLPPVSPARANSDAGGSPPAASETGDDDAVSVDPAWRDSDPLFDDDFELDYEPQRYPDPLEESNRRVLRFNGLVDRFFFDPLTVGYRLVTPSFARTGIRQFLLNLRSPAILVNDLLQLEFKDAGVTAARLLMNTTFGIGGFLEAGEAVGLERHESDFGQTLALVGVGSGPYLVVPIFGPTCLRDGAGVIVDAFMNPVLYVLGPFYFLGYTGGWGFAEREAVSDQLDALQKSSIDFYSALRSAHYQSRMSAIWDRREHWRGEKG